jgi:hypothetical protein
MVTERFFHQLIDITVSLSPLVLALRLARIRSPAVASLLHLSFCS